MCPEIKHYCMLKDPRLLNSESSTRLALVTSIHTRKFIQTNYLLYEASFDMECETESIVLVQGSVYYNFLWYMCLPVTIPVTIVKWQ